MVKRSRQPGLVDTAPKIKATPKKQKVGATTSSRSLAGKTFKTTKPAAGLRSGISGMSFGGDTKNNPAKAVKKQAPSKSICSVDFGTSYSGVAIVGSVNCGTADIEVLRNWVDGARRNEYFEKVPSRIAYPEENPGFEHITFGYEVTAAMKSYTWMKLLLSGSQDEFSDLRLESKAAHGMLELPSGKTAKDVVTDYLKCLYKHIMDHLTEVTPQILLAERPIEFWLTTPACWDNEANALTRECAMDAGFGTRAKDKLCMMSEPEAAILANLSTSIDRCEGIYKPGMNVCVVDIGGGTVDTQTLTLLELNPLKTKETCVGTGAIIGMTDIEFKLHDYCEATFGDSFKDLPNEVIGPSSDFAEEFEVIKRTFDGKDLNKKFWLKLSPLKKELEAANSSPINYDFVTGQIILKGTEIREMFERLIEKALEQVDNQVAQLKRAGLKPVSMIVLAGGGALSKYIIRRFQEHCQEKLGRIMVRRDENSWSTVVRGGAVRGLESGMVISRESKKAYGLACHKEFDESIDDEEDSFVCPIFGKRARGRMDWILHQGDTIVPGMKLTKLVYISPEDMDELVQYWDFYQCEDEEAPERLDDSGVKKIGRIRVALEDSEIARKKQRRSSESGKQEPIRIKLELTVGSAIGILEVHAFHGHTEVGRADIEYSRERGRMTHRVVR